MQVFLNPAGFDYLAPFIENSWYNTQLAAISSLRPAGFYLKNQMRKAVETNRFGWPQLARYTRTQASFRKPRTTARRWEKSNKPMSGGMVKNLGAGTVYREGNNIGSELYNHPPVKGKALWRSSNRNKRDAKERGFTFLHKLKNILRYLVLEDLANPRAYVGVLLKFTSDKAFMHFQKFQIGGPVEFSDSDSMRKYWGALGMPLKPGKALHRPARNLVDKLVQAERANVEQIMVKRYFDVITRANEDAEKFIEERNASAEYRATWFDQNTYKKMHSAKVEAFNARMDRVREKIDAIIAKKQVSDRKQKYFRLLGEGRLAQAPRAPGA